MIRHYDNLTDLWHESAMAMLFATRRELDYVSTADTMCYDNLLTCSSMGFDFDAGRDLWLTKSRFTILQRDYLELPALERFLDRCEDIGLGAAKRGVVTQMFAKDHRRADKKYKWGNCMMAWCFRGGDRYAQPTLTLHSRVSYIAYIGGLDLALCYVLAREISERIGCTPEEMAFRWSVDSLQFHGFKSLPYLYKHHLHSTLLEDTEEYPSAKHPTLKLVRRWYRDIVTKYDNAVAVESEKYGPLRRIRKRYEQHQALELMDPVPLSSLNFNPLKYG